MTQENQFAAMANYFRSMLTPTKEKVEESKPEPKPVIVKEQDPEERAKLVRIIDQVKPEVQTEVKIAEPVVEVKTQTIVEKQTKAVVEEKTVNVQDVKVETQTVVQHTSAVESEWKNIDVPDDFQALFFIVNGVTFAVPLLELGGISNMDKITSIIGKPSWFLGMMNVREDKFNVVDFVKWSMPQANGEIADFNYLIELGTTKWGVTCHELVGTESLHKSQVQWRSCAGKRPWLAGLVKERMCALIHVSELVKLFEKGININGN